MVTGLLDAICFTMLCASLASGLVESAACVMASATSSETPSALAARAADSSSKIAAAPAETPATSTDKCRKPANKSALEDAMAEASRVCSPLTHAGSSSEHQACTCSIEAQAGAPHEAKMLSRMRVAAYPCTAQSCAPCGEVWPSGDAWAACASRPDSNGCEACKERECRVCSALPPGGSSAKA